MANSAWPHDWDERVRGVGCRMCEICGADDVDGWGVRFWQGKFMDAYLMRVTPSAGYTAAVWNGPHVAEPTDLDAEAVAGYWHEVMEVGKAIQEIYRPAKMNYLTLGNAVPHLHTHLLPRYKGDPAPGRPLPWGLVESASTVPEVDLRQQVASLIDHLGGGG